MACRLYVMCNNYDELFAKSTPKCLQFVVICKDILHGDI